jgi:hypothetical protein
MEILQNHQKGAQLNTNTHKRFYTYDEYSKTIT